MRNFQDDEIDVLSYSSRLLDVVGGTVVKLLDNVLMLELRHGGDLCVQKKLPLLVERVVHHFDCYFAAGLLAYS